MELFEQYKSSENRHDFLNQLCVQQKYQEIISIADNSGIKDFYGEYRESLMNLMQKDKGFNDYFKEFSNEIKEKAELSSVKENLGILAKEIEKAFFHTRLNEDEDVRVAEICESMLYLTGNKEYPFFSSIISYARKKTRIEYLPEEAEEMVSRSIKGFLHAIDTYERFSGKGYGDLPHYTANIKQRGEKALEELLNS